MRLRTSTATIFQRSFGKTSGPHVLAIVEGCSQEKLPGERLSWQERNRRYIDQLDGASDEVVRVSLADKLANVRSMLRDHREEGDRLWERFNAPGPAAVIWYYESLAQRYATSRPGSMAEEFSHEVERLRASVQQREPPLPFDRRPVPEPLAIERLPAGTNLRGRFPQRRQLAVGEGWVLYEAERDDAPYLIFDEGTLADFIPPEEEDLLKRLIKVMRFESLAHRRAYVEARYGWELSESRPTDRPRN